MKKPNLLPYLIIFFLTFLVVQLFKGGGNDAILAGSDIGIKTMKGDYAVGKDIHVLVQNNKTESIEITYVCENTENGDFLLPPFEVLRYQNNEFIEVSNTQHLPECTEDKVITLQAGEKTDFSLLNYSYSYFGEIGRYKLELKTTDGETYSSPEFLIEEPGVLSMLWRFLIYNPLLNILIAILIYLPGHHLGWAVILLTLIIRTILLIPSQKAIKSQMRMQEIQPKLEELKKTYADNQTRLAEETMLLWKTAKVNPLSSCLPILIQIPILLALYTVISGGLSPDRSILIYDFLPVFSLHSINPNFLGFNLLERSLIIFPIVIGVLQFIQMQLMTYKRKKNAPEKTDKPMMNEMEMANKMMKYIMPVMIAVFTTQVPAAVGLYWGTSTFYGIIQQLVVNKGGSPNGSSPNDDVQIRVINRSHGKAN